MRTAALAAVLALGAALPAAGEVDEFRVKRETVFEFAEKPRVNRAGDRVTISFASKAYCDATVAIENPDGRIIRHLACGVLGERAPAPFKRGALKQTLVWDGKDDQGIYVEDPGSCTVRVALGLRPQFERTLFWSPQKRIGFSYPSLRAAPEGVYLAESCEVDQVKLFDHGGNYLRTVYPFPADKVAKVAGLKTHTFAQDGRTLPLKRGYCQATLLTCSGSEEYGAEGIVSLGAAGGRLAVVGRKLNRLASDGSTGGLPLEGPATSLAVAAGACGWGHPEATIAPLSAALSPDGKWLYLAGYEIGNCGYGGNMDWMNGVWRVPYAGDEPPKLFAGGAKPGVANGGTGPGQFRLASSVACDGKGRVYVGDYMNDRVQVFDADGKHLKDIPAAKPASVAVHQKTGDIYVFSWMLYNRLIPSNEYKVEATMTHLGPLENPKVKSACPLPLAGHNPTASWNVQGGLQHRVELDSWAEQPTIWVLNGKVGGGWSGGSGWGAAKEIMDQNQDAWSGANVRIYEEAGGKLVAKRNFAEEVKGAVVRQAAPILWRQRLYVNPASGKLYVAEGDSGVMKSVNQLVEISPEAGKVKLVDLPLGAEDLCFDLDGLLYIRTDTLVARYDPANWREIPWDYGEERKGHSYGMGARGADLISALPTPGHRSFAFWHLGGIDISPKGHLVVTTCNGAGMEAPAKGRYGEPRGKLEGRPYMPAVYPGRARWGEVHIWDKHGKLIAQDAVPGMTHLNGIGIDADDNIYLLAASRRLIDGKPLDPKLPADSSCTLLKVPAGKAKVLSASGSVPIPLPAEARPGRGTDLAANTGGVSGWVEGAEWFYGGVGFGAGGCVCWNCRFAKDHFNRSFAPEPLHCSVAVVDSAGNLILRVGRYGNVEDGKPLVAAGGPEKPRSIGDDEVALAYACYVGTHTDRRLFIADAGNARILSVKLGYHAEERLAVGNAK